MPGDELQQVALDEQGAVLFMVFRHSVTFRFRRGKAKDNLSGGASEQVQHLAGFRQRAGKDIVDKEPAVFLLSDHPGVGRPVKIYIFLQELCHIEQDQAGVIHHVKPAAENAAPHGIFQELPVGGSIHCQLLKLACAGRGQLSGRLIFRRYFKAESGIKVKDAVVCEEIDAVAFAAVFRVDSCHEFPDQSLPAVGFVCHYGSQLEKVSDFSLQ